MDITVITQLISTVGFPIVMCVGMGWFIKYTTDANREALKLQDEKHTQEMANITEALNNNTIALTKLCEKMGGK